MTLWAINRAAHGRRENYAIKIIQIKEGFCVCESGFTMYEFFKIDDRVLKAAEEAEQKAAPYLAKISETQRYNQEKMQAAFMQAGVSESHFVATTGYGYGDRGRDVLDEVYARALGAEDALCRYNFVSGTHTLTVALFGVLRPGDTMLSVTGMPYDTLRGVIGITGDGNGSLKEFGINYEQLDLLPDGTPDYDGMETAITPKHRMVYIQRSRGYSLRPSLTVEEIERIVKIAKRRAPDCIVMVDNCYGEYVQKMEPTAVGADLMAGSLIKNPGGGIAPTGGWGYNWGSGPAWDSLYIYLPYYIYFYNGDMSVLEQMWTAWSYIWTLWRVCRKITRSVSGLEIGVHRKAQNFVRQ